MRLNKRLSSYLSSDTTSFDNALFMESPVPSLVSDTSNKIITVNRAFLQLTGFAEVMLIGSSTSLYQAQRHNSYLQQARLLALEEQGFYKGEMWSCHADGSEQLLVEKVQRIDHRSKSYYLCLFEDVTDARVEMDRYRHLAMHDALTGLANRSLAEDRFMHAMVNAVRAGEKIGLLLCDLNEFKQVNDTYGHYIGDQLLVAVGKKLQSLVREGDTVARIGGDEFLLIIEHLKSKDELLELLQKIKVAMKETTSIEKHLLKTCISIGEACAIDDGMNYDTLLRIADHNMYRQKEYYYGYRS